MAISTPRAPASRPPLSSLLPAVDASALGLAWAASGSDPLALGLAGLTFIVLNGDASRRFRLQPTLGDEAGWLLSRVATAVLVSTAIVWLGGLWWWDRVPLLDRLAVAA